MRNSCCVVLLLLAKYIILFSNQLRPIGITLKISISLLGWFIVSQCSVGSVPSSPLASTENPSRYIQPGQRNIIPAELSNHFPSRAGNGSFPAPCKALFLAYLCRSGDYLCSVNFHPHWTEGSHISKSYVRFGPPASSKHMFECYRFNYIEGRQPLVCIVSQTEFHNRIHTFRLLSSLGWVLRFSDGPEHCRMQGSNFGKLTAASHPLGQLMFRYGLIVTCVTEA